MIALITKESTTAGPACVAAAWPVSTKMPAPMMPPIPIITRFVADKDRFSVPSPEAVASFCRAAMLLRAKGLMVSFLGSRPGSAIVLSRLRPAQGQRQG